MNVHFLSTDTEPHYKSWGSVLDLYRKLVYFTTISKMMAETLEKTRSSSLQICIPILSRQLSKSASTSITTNCIYQQDFIEAVPQKFTFPVKYQHTNYGNTFRLLINYRLHYTEEYRSIIKSQVTMWVIRNAKSSHSNMSKKLWSSYHLYQTPHVAKELAEYKIHNIHVHSIIRN